MSSTLVSLWSGASPCYPPCEMLVGCGSGAPKCRVTATPARHHHERGAPRGRLSGEDDMLRAVGSGGNDPD
jgi:hypothetical protein